MRTRAILNSREKRLLQALWHSPMSRLQLHRQTAIRQMTIVRDVERLLRAGLVRELPASARARGRPQIPVALDPDCCGVAGVSLRPGSVGVARLNLRGELTGEERSAPARRPQEMIATAARLVEDCGLDTIIGLGISAPGFVDPLGQAVLFSSAFPSFGRVRLDPLLKVVGDIPRVLENDTHALAANWLLRNRGKRSPDTLLIFMEDGQIGSALLIDGRPNRGCVGGGNELGHTRLQVDTPRCYCGRRGCLERIFSSPYLSSLDGRRRRLADAVESYSRSDRAMVQIIHLLAEGLANAVNFTRAGEVIFVGDFCRQEDFIKSLEMQIRDRLLPILSQRVHFDRWAPPPRPRSGEMAGWLALAAIYLEGWVEA